MGKRLTDYTITRKIVVDPEGSEPEISDADLKRVADSVSKRMEEEFTKTFGFTPKFPATIELQPKPTCRCYLFHRGDCPFLCL